MRKNIRYIMLISLSLSILAIAYLGYERALHAKYCEAHSEVVPGISIKGNYNVVIENETCDALGPINTVSVKMRGTHFWNFGKTIFVYEPIYDVGNTSGSPVVKFDGRNTLKISINTIADVVYEDFNVRGVHVVYEIGKIAYK